MVFRDSRVREDDRTREGGKVASTALCHPGGTFRSQLCNIITRGWFHLPTQSTSPIPVQFTKATSTALPQPYRLIVMNSQHQQRPSYTAKVSVGGGGASPFKIKASKSNNRIESIENKIHQDETKSAIHEQRKESFWEFSFGS